MVRSYPTDKKVQFINAILKCGFDTVEVGSIVSPKVIPQMSDTLEVISRIGSSDYRDSKPMVLVVNKRGGEIAVGA